MPTRVPTLLINGATGIAVGMATNMPHNLTEVIDGTLAYMDNNDIEIDELINYIKAPDFPTEVLFMVMKVFVKHSKLEEESGNALKLALKRSRVENVLSFLKFQVPSQ
jgi:DNA gyrase/topoisomerase IV subunit A